jgi:putative MFS transporter
MLEHLERQKKLTINQWKIFAAATIGDMLDFFDFLLIAFILAFVVKDWNLTYGQGAVILLASGVSAPFGSLVWGWVADRIGRRKVMIATILNFSIATGLMALTPEHGWVFWRLAASWSGSASPASTPSISPWSRSSSRPQSAAGSPG